VIPRSSSITSPSPRVAARVSTRVTRLAVLGCAAAALRARLTTPRASCGDLEDRGWCLRHLRFLASCVSAGRRADTYSLMGWTGAGSNRRSSAFQVNRAKRYADLRKRTLLTSGTALGGRCNAHASSAQYTPSTRQDSDRTQDHRDRRWRDHGRHPLRARRWPVRSVPTLDVRYARFHQLQPVGPARAADRARLHPRRLPAVPPAFNFRPARRHPHRNPTRHY
jgi:hypothetical protein